MGSSGAPLLVTTSTEMGCDKSAVMSWQGSDLTADWLLPISVLVWVHSFIEPDLFDNNVLFDNTTLIYLINLLWKLGSDSDLHYFSIFHGE